MAGGPLLKECDGRAVRIAWRTVGSIIERVVADTGREVDLLAGLRRIGIDEISYRRGQRYITVVIDHDTGRLVWAAPGRDRKTVLSFLDALGSERCKQMRLVSADMAAWIAGWLSAAQTPCCASTLSTWCKAPPTHSIRFAAIEHELSNARVEAANTTIRLIASRAFGFHTPEALIALAKLRLSGLCPPLPGRTT